MSNDSESLTLPAEWFHIASESIIRNYNESTWPWTYVNVEEFVDLLILYENYVGYYSANISQKIMWTFSALGIIGGVLILATIIKMPKSARTNFYKITCLIAVIDLAFLIDVVIRKPLMLQFERTTVVNIVMFVTSATTFFFSLVSDLLTLALSVERFIALTFPAFYKRMDKTTERRIWNSIILVSVVISLCRARYAFDNSLYTIHSVADTTFFLYLTYFSDMIIPVVTAAVMIVMVLGILRALIRRTWSKIYVGNQTMHKHISDCMKTMSLLGVLVFLFLLNQCNYIYFEVEYLRRQNARLSFESSLAEVQLFVQLIINLELAANVSTVAEMASKTFTFYNYIMFNANFRKYFLTMIQMQRVVGSSLVGRVSSIVQVHTIIRVRVG